MKQPDLSRLKDDLRKFAKKRDWDKFHSPKNLSMALAVEASELLEHFQWLTENESAHLDREALSAIEQEIADVQIYLIRLADKLGVDISTAVRRKMQLNESRYPARLVKGSAKKYSRYIKR